MHKSENLKKIRGWKSCRQPNVEEQDSHIFCVNITRSIWIQKYLFL